mgnify:CR=1 FL=1
MLHIRFIRNIVYFICAHELALFGSVRQYQPMQSHFLQRIPYGKPPYDLLTVRDVTPARKGLSPSGNLPPVGYASIKFVYFYRGYDGVKGTW